MPPALGLTLSPMAFVTGGPRPAMPATAVSWNEAARFTNWLNASQGFPAAYKFSTQPGEPGYNANADINLWVTGDAGFDASNPFRNSQAHYFLPSVDEWYKAAFFDPNRGAGGYWDYPTGSDAAPTPVASGTAPGTAVNDQTLEQGPADITLAGGLSPYGTMAQGGNVAEWQETEWDLVNDTVSAVRGVRGAVWDFDSESSPPYTAPTRPPKSVLATLVFASPVSLSRVRCGWQYWVWPDCCCGRGRHGNP